MCLEGIDLLYKQGIIFKKNKKTKRRNIYRRLLFDVQRCFIWACSFQSLSAVDLVLMYFTRVRYLERDASFRSFPVSVLEIQILILVWSNGREETYVIMGNRVLSVYKMFNHMPLCQIFKALIFEECFFL